MEKWGEGENVCKYLDENKRALELLRGEEH